MRSRTLLIGALTGALLVVPGAAHASTLTSDGGTLLFKAASGEENHVMLQAAYDGSATVRVTTSGPSGAMTAIPAECEDHRDWGYVECPTPQAVKYELLDGDDSYGTTSDSNLPKDIKITVEGDEGKDDLSGWVQQETFIGGPGNDELSGWLGDDTLDGGDGEDTLEGKGGNDHLLGGAGNDMLMPDGYEEAAKDVVDGGDGIDSIESDYSSRFTDLDPPVAITFGGGADDGRPGEGDDLRNVERLTLSVGGRVVGSDAGEYVKLHQVGDNGELIGNGGDDELRGGDGEDKIDGGAGNDKIDGGYGDDTIVGGPGRDVISADLQTGDCGPLWCKYPYGNDTVDVRDGEADSVSCGAGTDKVTADAADTVAPDCETVERSGGGSGPTGPTGPTGPITPGQPTTSTAKIKLAGATKLRTALRRGLTLKLTGVPAGLVAVKALSGKKTVAKGMGTAKANGTAKVTVRFTKAAKKALARKRSVKLTIVAGSARAAVTLKR